MSPSAPVGIPSACGPISTAVIAHLTRTDPPPLPTEVAAGDERDHALALWVLFELSYRGFDGVDEDLEWDPALIALRGLLEDELESDLRRDWADWSGPRDLTGLIEHDAERDGTSAFVRRDATRDDVLEILKQKSIYHLKEADPHSFVLPRLEPAPKAALAELQYDELGDGDPERVHMHLFAQAMEAAGLNPRYGAYIDEASSSTLTLSNAMSMLCLRRRLRFAAMGHLAAFEGTSSLPSADMVRGLRRLGFDERVARYYDEHVEADAVHEHLARRDICDRMTQGDPELEHEVAFGAWVCLELEARNAASLLPVRAAA